MTRDQFLSYFKLYSNSKSDGFEKFLSTNNNEGNFIYKRLEKIDSEPLNKVQLNQLLVLSGLPGITFGFFKFYWLSVPEKHLYDVKKMDDFDDKFIKTSLV